MERNSDSDFEVVPEGHEGESIPLLDLGANRNNAAAGRGSNRHTPARPTESSSPGLFRTMPISLVSAAVVVLFVATYGPYSVWLSYVTRIEPAWAITDCNDNLDTPMRFHPHVRTIISRIISNPPGCRIITREFEQSFTNLPTQHIYTSAKKLPYPNVNASAGCIEAVENFFANDTYDFTSASKKQEPLYAWNGSYPCTEEAQRVFDRKISKVFTFCSPRDINFSNDKKVQLTKIVLDESNKIRYTCIKNHFLLPEKYHAYCEENPHEPPERNFTGFLHATKHYKGKRIECTRCTKQWLRELRFSGYFEEGRLEMQLKRFQEAAKRCDDPDVWGDFSMALSEYGYQREWGFDFDGAKSKDLKEILIKGMLPGDFPIANLSSAITYENSSVGLDTFTEVLTSDGRCYPFISQRQFWDDVDHNPLMQHAYCDNCDKGYMRRLTKVIADDIRRPNKGEEEPWQLEEKFPFNYINASETGRVDEALKEIWNRVIVRDSNCPDVYGGLSVIEETFEDYKPESVNKRDVQHVTLHQYVEDLRKVKAMLDTDSETVRALLDPSASDAEELKKAHVCKAIIELVIDTAFKREGGEFWWQPFRNAYVSWEQYRDLVKEMIGVTREWYTLCRTAGGPHYHDDADSRWKEEIDQLLTKDLAEAGVKGKADNKLLEKVYGKDGRWNDYWWVQGRKGGRVLTGTIGERKSKGKRNGKQ